MGNELQTARKKLNSVNTYLKQDKYRPAVQAVSDSIVLMLKSSLMKNEREEFADLLANATTYLNNNKKLREIYPLVISYEPGNEKALYESLQELLREIDAMVSEDAQGTMAAREQLKQTSLDQGQKHLDNEEFEQAQKVFDELLKDFNNDTNLKTDIADRYLKAERYKEALGLLETALEDDPNAIHLYNRIGIVLRKLQDFETAEKYYLKALNICSNDEYLYFNIGRLYFDWKQWKKMAGAAERALAINPEFDQATKMLQFARKKLQ